MNWLVLSIITIVSWGFMGLFLKIASKYVDWPQTYIIANAVVFAAALLVYISQKPSIVVGSPGFNYALIAGFVSSFANIGFYSALQAGKAIVVIPLTSLYPVITVALSYLILHEEITLTKGLGIMLALLAIVLVSIE